MKKKMRMKENGWVWRKMNEAVHILLQLSQICCLRTLRQAIWNLLIHRSEQMTG